MATEHSYSFEALRNRLTVSGQLVARTALRIGAGRASGVVGNDLPVLRDALGAPIIPGASLKGALRAQVEALVRSLHPGQARDLIETEDVMRRAVAAAREEVYLAELSRGTPAPVADQRYTAALLSSPISTLMDLTFGSPWLASRVAVRDARVDPAYWFGQFEVRNGVALNRDTETAEEGLLYDYEVVPAGTRFDFQLVLENAAPWQLGLIHLALQPWVRGEAQIGGFRSRGLGYVMLEAPRYRFVEINDVDDVLRLLCDAATLEALGVAQGDVELSPDPTAPPVKGWYEQLRRTLAKGQPPAQESTNA